MKKVNREITNFLKKVHLVDYDLSPLAGDASSRRYYRLKRGKQSLILMDSSTMKDTTGSFLNVQKYLSDNKFSVPQVLHVDQDNGYIILEDLGNQTLDKYLFENNKNLGQIYSFAVDLLVSLSTLSNPPFPEFDKQFFLGELSTFTTWYLPYIGRSLDDQKVGEFNASWNKALEYLSVNDEGRVFVHKDIHCGNLFWLPERSGIRKLGIIDFQSAKSGSTAYDVTSLFYDCRLPLPRSLRESLLNKYVANIKLDRKNFKNICDIFIAQRNIKILGNFTHIYQQRKNPTYLKFLPNAWEFVEEALDNSILEEVKAWFAKNSVNTSMLDPKHYRLYNKEVRLK